MTLSVQSEGEGRGFPMELSTIKIEEKFNVNINRQFFFCVFRFVCFEVCLATPKRLRAKITCDGDQSRKFDHKHEQSDNFTPFLSLFVAFVSKKILNKSWPSYTPIQLSTSCFLSLRPLIT